MTAVDSRSLAAADPSDARAVLRAGTVSPTAGWAPGYTQANLVAVPRDWAYDLLLFAQRNPKLCPVLDVTDPGAVSTPWHPVPICVRTCPATESGEVVSSWTSRAT